MQQYVSNRMRVLQAAMAVPVIAGMLFLSGCGRVQRTAEGSSETTKQGQEYKTPQLPTQSSQSYEVKGKEGDVKTDFRTKCTEEDKARLLPPSYVDMLSASMRAEGNYMIFVAHTVGTIPDRGDEKLEEILAYQWIYNKGGDTNIIEIAYVPEAHEKIWGRKGWVVSAFNATKGDGVDITKESTVRIKGQDIELRTADAQYANGIISRVSASSTRKSGGCLLAQSDVLNK